MVNASRTASDQHTSLGAAAELCFGTQTPQHAHGRVAALGCRAVQNTRSSQKEHVMGCCTTANSTAHT